MEGRDPLPGGYDQVDRIEPLVQRHMGSLENGSRPDGEDFQTCGASVVPVDAASRFQTDSVSVSAEGTDGATVPPNSLDMLPGRPLVGKSLYEFIGADRDLVHDVPPSVVD